ncbi:aminotransferase class V-fold PLP-dependent enzyme [bacterium]|nr:aminotransferase class V-fold PLP-dependent enzyme [bacterium]
MVELKPRLGSRELFPNLAAPYYLCHAGVSPLSLPVQRAVADFVQHFAGEGVGAVGGMLAMRDRLREKLGLLLGCGAQDLALTCGTSWGVLAIAQNFPWRQGDRIACVQGEFPTNVTPWQRAADQHGLELVFLKPDLSDLQNRLDQGLRLLALSAVSFQTGLRQPWEEVARQAQARGCQVFVDAIQAAGVVPFAVGQLDYVAGGAHKWLMGVEGCGYLYVRPDHQAELKGHWAGWLSHREPVRFLFEGAGHLRYDRPLRPEPQALEIGSSSYFSQAALEASLNLILDLRVDQIFDHVTRYLDLLEPQLDFPGWTSLRKRQALSGSLCLKPGPETNLADWSAALGRRGLKLATPDGLLRISPHWPNSLEEVPRVVEIFKEVHRELDLQA